MNGIYTYARHFMYLMDTRSSSSKLGERQSRGGGEEGEL